MIGLLAATVTAVFFPGLILRTKSMASGRKGPGILQPWHNIALLLRKGEVISTTTSYIFRLAPAVYLSTVVVALLLLPFPGAPSLFGFDGDFVLLAYLLALGRFFMILGALDTGSPFEGMGANREALYSMLAEPAFFILFATMALLTGHTSMQEIFTTFSFSGHYGFIPGIIAVYLLVQIAMVENSRMPVDDPKTHLELTMIHEVMILDHSGFDLALVQTATTLKFAVYGLLITSFILPAAPPAGWVSAGAALFQWGGYFVIQAAFAVWIGLMESFRARKKLGRNPQFIATLGSIALVAFILALMILFNLA